MDTIHRIEISLPLHLGSVNCYLIHRPRGAILVDTGCSRGRRKLEEALASAGCTPDDLRLIVLTHGDFDHAGNAAYLRARYGAPVAMHPGDAELVQSGDMFAGRQNRNRPVGWFTPLLFRYGRREHFTPDRMLKEGDDLSAYGWDAHVLELPGHSAGSIGLLTPDGDLLCGDLLENNQQPCLNSIMDDREAARATVERLRTLSMRQVLPGHGEPFALQELR